MNALKQTNSVGKKGCHVWGLACKEAHTAAKQAN
jgi:hypothetical protein